MMHDRPDGARLLELARETLLREITTLGEDRRHEIALIARAMAIAARELAAAAREPSAAGYGGLTELYGDGDPDSLLRRLALDIRSGRHDAPGPVREAVRSLLWTLTREKLRHSNPDYLAAGESAQASQKTLA